MDADGVIALSQRNAEQWECLGCLAGMEGRRELECLDFRQDGSQNVLTSDATKENGAAK